MSIKMRDTAARFAARAVVLAVCMAALASSAASGFGSGSAEASSDPVSSVDVVNAATQAGESADSVIEWQSDPSVARRMAVGSNRPVLLYATMAGCGACIFQELAFEDPAVARELSFWVRLRLDVNEYHEVALQLMLVGTPALRASTALGKTFASQDGYLPAEELLIWLENARRKATASAESAANLLASTGALDEEEVSELVTLLEDRQPEIREAAIDRLSREGEAASEKVVMAFVDGGLAARLSAFEILKIWDAPVALVDPWQPETVARGAEALSEWLDHGEFAMALPTRAELDADFEALIFGDDARAAGAMARLARVGGDLLEEVRSRLAVETRDLPRERLTLLRYRLVMPGEIARDEPQLVQALVSPNASVRAGAVESLEKRGGARLEPLFLELFQDSDPLVREVALRSLRRTSGRAANATLAQLLEDPQPNVRAQVLKELALSPSADMLGILAEYIERETDADLLVPALRVLSNMKSGLAAKAVAALAENPSWQVRAEVAESLGAFLSPYFSGRTKVPPGTADFLRTLVSDDDPFVVAKAVEACDKAEIEAVEELAAAAEKFSELAPAALAAMASNSDSRGKAVAYLRKFLTHAEAPVRAAALSAMVECTQLNVADELKAAFNDGDTRVRQAAAGAVATLVRSQEKVPASFAAPWREPLLAMLTAEEPRERCAGALTLIALNIIDEPLPVLKSLAAEHGEFAPEAGRCLPKLPWAERKDLFEYLVSLDLSEEAYVAAIEGFAEEPVKEVAEYLWKEVDNNAKALDALYTFQHALQGIYFGREGVYDKSMRSPALVKLMAQEAAARIDSTDERRRALALALFVAADPVEAAMTAETLFTAEASSPETRRNALALEMFLEPKRQISRAVDAVKSADEHMQTLGLAFLAEGSGSSECQTLEAGESMVYLRNYEGLESFKIDELPKSMTADILLPFLSSPDADTRARAAYLLARLNDAAGIATLAQVWRQTDSSSAEAFLIEAVSALNDDSYTPLLEELYASMDKDEYVWEIREFYWSIRSMRGPKILALRKRIRDEVGMDNLR